MEEPERNNWGIFGQNRFLSFGTSKCVSAARIEAFNAEK
jgi:hypothetical protein